MTTNEKVDFILNAIVSIPGLPEDIRKEGEKIAAESHVKPSSASPELRKAIAEKIMQLGTPCNVLGYKYSIEAIAIIVEGRGKDIPIMKGVYTPVAKIFSSTPNRVERAIRHSIEIVTTRCDYDLFRETFGCAIDPSKGTPTNAHYLYRIAEIVSDELGWK